MSSERWGAESFDSLYRESFPAVVGSVRWIVGDVEVAREIAQDAFVAALVHWRKVSSYEKPGTWVRRVAIREAVRVAKKARARPAFIASGSVAQGEPELDVREAVLALPAAQRAAVVLRYMHDLSISEVARTMGWSEGTAKTHLFRARKALAVALAVEGED